jgi:hypothetical protein
VDAPSSGRVPSSGTNKTRSGTIVEQDGGMDAFPPDLFLASYPDRIRAAADRLRALVRQVVPDAVERVRPGWRLIGYDLPVGRRSVYFAYVAPEPIHVHLGFEVGVFMRDPDRLLEGAHLRLRKVRYLTFAASQAIPEAAVLGLIREAALVAALSREQRLSLVLDREWGPELGPTGHAAPRPATRPAGG